MTVTIPEHHRAFVAAQAARYGLASPDAYIEALIYHAQSREHRIACGVDPEAPLDTVKELGMTEEQFIAFIQKGLDSGPVTEMTRADWDELKRLARERHAEKVR